MFSRPDTLAKVLLDRGYLTVDLEQGAIYGPAGNRVEILDKRHGYGRVHVYSRPPTFAQAHRVIWVAAHGLIPPGLHVNHRNRIRWDNRLANLEVVTPAGNCQHWQGRDYDAAGADGNVSPGWLSELDHEPTAGRELDPYLGTRDRTRRHGAHRIRLVA